MLQLDGFAQVFVNQAHRILEVFPCSSYIIRTYESTAFEKHREELWSGSFVFIVDNFPKRLGPVEWSGDGSGDQHHQSRQSRRFFHAGGNSHIRPGGGCSPHHQRGILRGRHRPWSRFQFGGRYPAAGIAVLTGLAGAETRFCILSGMDQPAARFLCFDGCEHRQQWPRRLLKRVICPELPRR